MSSPRLSVAVHVVPTSGPGDVSGLAKLIADGALDAKDIVAILGKTEGNGSVNDFTREYATFSLRDTLAPYLRLTPEQVEDRIAFVMSGGTEGVLAPHLTVFSRKSISGVTADGKRLSIGISHTRDFLPEEIGRTPQIEETAHAVHAAMADGGIEDANDVHFVQIKCPLLTSARVEAARGRGNNTVTTNTLGSMGHSRGASALGVAVALNEVPRPIRDEDVLKDWSLFSRVASTSAGIELMRNIVIVMGNSAHSVSPYVVGHAVMRDAIDLTAVNQAFANAGLGTGAVDTTRLVNVFAKAEASPDGRVRNARHTMLEDSDIGATRHARAAVGGLVAAVSGTGLVYVSGGAEHQGPAGGGPIAVIART